MEFVCQSNQLLTHIIAVYPRGLLARSFSPLPVSGQQQPPLADERIHDLRSVGGLIMGIITQDPEPFGQPAQHGIRHEPHTVPVVSPC